jgi:hypothetical protein
MRFYKVFSLIVLVLAAASSGISQEEKQRTDGYGRFEVNPEIMARAKRQFERLNAPSFIKLKIEPESKCRDEDSKKVSDCYTAGSRIGMKLFMTNTSSETISFTTSGSYFSYNLQLFRDGQLVPYRKDIVEIIDKPSAAVYRNLLIKLEPGKTELIDMIYLERWYEPLEPGHYQLEIKRRFMLDGGWTDTASTTFEVAPE